MRKIKFNRKGRQYFGSYNFSYKEDEIKELPDDQAARIVEHNKHAVYVDEEEIEEESDKSSSSFVDFMKSKKS